MAGHTGGAAFPCQPRDPQGGFVEAMQPGMTKREAFALAALQGILANSYYAQQAESPDCSGNFAAAAVFHADALLAELEPQA